VICTKDNGQIEDKPVVFVNTLCPNLLFVMPCPRKGKSVSYWLYPL